MARGKSPDLKSQFGSFLRTTLQQLDTVREVVVQKGRQGKIQLDITLLRRKRKDVLAELGGVVAELCQEGRLSEDDFPEISAALSHLEAIDQKIAEEELRARATAAGMDDYEAAAGGWSEPEYDDEDDLEEYMDEEPEAEDDPEPPASRRRRQKA